ncbi:RING-H2 finger protein ATL54 [Dichanthelium oligosanthes]|uniref:RING-type E3 ubiquitin transferase n=1 Tax=Dichanthelium oligosanthes TaxID=888268 RepID=A0A1E5V9I2_9POAL|nr:RING-H2 finger protein ATL54 [Dichanthelium oligosanthes]
MRHHRRVLFRDSIPGGEGCHPLYGFGCPPPPSVASSPDPGPAPQPSAPSIIPPCPPYVSPSPAPHGGSGRRDQGGTYGYVPPPPGVGGAGDDHRRDYVRYVLIAAGVIAFVSLILLGVSVAVRRRQVRRRRQALLAPPAAAPADVGDGGGDDPEGGGVVHHIWYIRTVGLDEASINSIAATRYRAGAGLLGVADCSVCLGEFQDGELLRLLPKCGHAFHVPCIDTWLRAHVNCPLCRSHVLDPAVTAVAEDSGGGGETTSSDPPPADPDANANAEAEQAGAASDAIPDHDQEESDSQEEEASHAQEDQDEQSAPPPPPQLFCALPRNVRRAASMDAAIVSTAADVAALERLPEAAAPEEEQIGAGRRKRSCAKASGSGHRSNLSVDRPPSGGIPRSFFSRHSRARSSVLPLTNGA